MLFQTGTINVEIIFSVAVILCLMYSILITFFLGPKAIGVGIVEYTKNGFIRDDSKRGIDASFITAIIFLILCIVIILSELDVISMSENASQIIGSIFLLWISIPSIARYHLVDRKKL